MLYFGDFYLCCRVFELFRLLYSYSFIRKRFNDFLMFNAGNLWYTIIYVLSHSPTVDIYSRFTQKRSTNVSINSRRFLLLTCVFNIQCHGQLHLFLNSFDGSWLISQYLEVKWFAGCSSISNCCYKYIKYDVKRIFVITFYLDFSATRSPIFDYFTSPRYTKI